MEVYLANDAPYSPVGVNEDFTQSDNTRTFYLWKKELFSNIFLRVSKFSARKYFVILRVKA